MSYILDALRKSDQERKQSNVPGLQTMHMPVAAEAEPVRWHYVIIVFLALSLVFVLGTINPWESEFTVQENQQEKKIAQPKMLAEKKTAAKNSPPVILPTEKSQKEIKNIEKILPTISKIKTVQAERPQLDVKQQIVVQTKATQPKTNQQQVKSRRPAIKKPTEVSDDTPVDVESVLHLYEMPSLVQQAIPDMVFAGHVFSTSVEQRSVVINDHFMSEGDTIIDGLAVERITQKGIVFNYRGQLFRMDVLQDWSFD